MTPMSSNLADYGQFCIDLTPKRLDLADSEHICHDLTPMRRGFRKIHMTIILLPENMQLLPENYSNPGLSLSEFYETELYKDLDRDM